MITVGALEIDRLGELSTAFMLVFVRIGSLLMATPVFRSTGMPLRVRIILALCVAGMAMASLPADFRAPPVGVGLIPILLWEVALGLAMGIIVQMVFAALAIAGEAVAMGMGLGFANMVDPQSGASVPTMSQQFVLLATLLFVALNGHLLMLQMLFDSFSIIPPGARPLSPDTAGLMLTWAAKMYAHALFVALPVLVAMLLTNLAFGVITRAAPQLNIFAIGFPMMLVIGLAVVLVNVEHLIGAARGMLDEAYLTIARLLALQQADIDGFSGP